MIIMKPTILTHPENQYVLIQLTMEQAPFQAAYQTVARKVFIKQVVCMTE